MLSSPAKWLLLEGIEVATPGGERDCCYRRETRLQLLEGNGVATAEEGLNCCYRRGTGLQRLEKKGIATTGGEQDYQRLAIHRHPTSQSPGI